jgi:dienelactone hydrolase
MRAASAIAAIFACSVAMAEVKTETIQYEHDGQKLQGMMAWDDAVEGPRPGVLVVHEWWGMDNYAKSRAKMLAELGYVAFALDMYGVGKITEHPSTAGEWANQIRQNVPKWRARASEGLRILREHPKVDKSRIGAIGYCFGGATVMQLAYAGEDLKGVVSFHGSLPVAEGDDAKKIKGRVLICHGADDSFIPADRIAKFQAALSEADADWTMIYYANAQHSFTNPEADSRGVQGLAYNKEADQRSWRHMQIFLEEIFAK